MLLATVGLYSDIGLARADGATAARARLSRIFKSTQNTSDGRSLQRKLEYSGFGHRPLAQIKELEGT